jgi:hypothetical protein
MDFDPNDDPDDDGCECNCGDPDCPECGGDCWYCGGAGFQTAGIDVPTDIGVAPGTIVRCRCCHGSGLAQDCTFW